MSDILSTLQECSWRDIPFPIASIQESGQQDAPQHKRADRDGAFVEGTGRAPFVYKVRGVFIAGTIARGKNETWDDLFPATFLRIRDAWMDRTTGTLVHPIYGPVRCKPATWDVVLDPEIRGGVFVDMSFVETNDDAETPAFTPSERSFAKATAADLDAQLGTLSPSPEVFAPQDEEQSFSELVDSLTAVVDSTTLQGQRAIAKIDAGIGKLQRLSNSINRASSVVVTDATTGTTTNLGPLGAGAARIWQNCQNLATSLREIRSKLLANTNRDVATYILERPAMLVALSIQLKNTVAELLELNPTLPRARPVIPAYTLVKYYPRS
ncbi:DNA circularization N-terminal domain-containing protein [Polyangium sp. 15x6]|uniref:DNA circularization N-terminal domain-containing protein n=1 Tax=Polyangium sp. 15x6 TaxID=3042687 RepID=UPI00249A261C|nr:DNA circularization N-terminal domain-containing protein [Polyangium sp. 15x6]MDI3282111.1 DNA circularization N-terminal domain-containing protein [Polyangium sp. 15x6]